MTLEVNKYFICSMSLITLSTKGSCRSFKSKEFRFLSSEKVKQLTFSIFFISIPHFLKISFTFEDQGDWIPFFGATTISLSKLIFLFFPFSNLKALFFSNIDKSFQGIEVSRINTSLTPIKE